MPSTRRDRRAPQYPADAHGKAGDFLAAESQPVSDHRCGSLLVDAVTMMGFGSDASSQAWRGHAHDDGAAAGAVDQNVGTAAVDEDIGDQAILKGDPVLRRNRVILARAPSAAASSIKALSNPAPAFVIGRSFRAQLSLALFDQSRDGRSCRPSWHRRFKSEAISSKTDVQSSKRVCR